ncbi:MAG TPA: phospholipase D-like domain-containing protein [Kofleriaceae bacterium]|nr:phospholipase D-like domain-containing protein [Kofleriaceae bacterium]
MRTTAAIIASLLIGGCGAYLEGDADQDDANMDESLSSLGKGVVSTLRAKHPTTAGQTWGVAIDNSFASGWLLQTPPAEYWGQPSSALPVATDCGNDAACDRDFHLIRCTSQADCRFGGRCSDVAATVTRPGEAARRMCVGHSDSFYDEIYKVITSAHSYVDIASLEAPDGRFEAAVRNAFTFLANDNRSVRVRLLYGAVPLRGRETAEVLTTLTRDLPASSPLRISVGTYRTTVLSWNHTKLIGADGHVAIVGGHNMWTQHYLQEAPVHDISLRVTGTAAVDASKFANELWQFTCHPPTNIGAVGEISALPADESVCQHPFQLTSTAAAALETGTVPVITVGKLGGLDGDEGEDAILALLDSAQTQLRLSLQDIGGIGQGGPWPEHYLKSLAAALGRGVDIQLVLTTLRALPGGLMVGSASYSNGWTPADVAHKLIEYADAHPDVAGDIRSAVCAHLHVTSLRQGADDVWTNGAALANHAKLAIADDAAFYMGSQNWYPAQLSELGYIVDDAATTRGLLDSYYSKLWSASSRVAANTCGL